MKKFVSILAVLTISLASAQVNPKGTVELVPLVGYSSANYYGDITTANSEISGVNFGVAADYYFNDQWSLRSGAFYQTMGTEFGGDEDRLKYVTIPINANWHFSKNRRWNLNFGPSFGFLSSAESTINGVKIDLDGFVETFQLGLNIGIGYKIEISQKFSLLIDYQAMAGLTKVADFENVDLKNTYGSLNVGGVLKL